MRTAKILDSNFVGVSVQTKRDDLNNLIDRGSTGVWRGNMRRVLSYKMIMVMDMSNKGRYFTAEIIGAKTKFKKSDPGKGNKGIEILFQKPSVVKDKKIRNLRFLRSPIQYIN